MEYKILNPTTMLSPLPCVLVSCGAEGMHPNALTVAWTGIVNTHPPMLSISVKPERYSHDLIIRSGEFCVHPGDKDHVRVLDFCGVKSGKEVDKFSALGLKTEDSGLQYAPAISGFPLCISCRLRDVHRLGSHDLFLGEICRIMVREDLMDDNGSVHLERAGLVSYSHGLYQEVGKVLGFFGFSVARRDTYERRMKNIRSGYKPHA